MKIELSKKAAKALMSQNPPTQTRIAAGIRRIPEGDIKPVKGSSGTFRLRVGDWRILFSYPSKDNVLIEKIAPRGDVYKGG
ncbi:MAG: type II toxin-antitoxin system RelE/ParE family toxin [Oscillospiraceae bacterium]|jgi:mRNA interferase RelE/StbE|nr:type II toxin-antitoxin system RelE/ParE family toxin [Oscillospiraceae bacterium]